MISRKLSFDHSALSTLSISLENVKHNIETIQTKIGLDTRLMAIVKASAYGTNIIVMAKALSEMGVDYFGVATVEEAITLRQSGIKDDIFVIHTPHFQLHHIPEWNLHLAISDKESLNILEEIASAKKIVVNVHIHVNTGMNRFGCRPENALDLAKAVHSSAWLDLAGVMSHFHSSDIPEKDEDSRNQIRLFDQVIDTIEKNGIEIRWKHLANSSAVCRFHLPQYNMVRVGIAMFGVHLTQVCQRALPLKLAVTLRAKIIDIKTCYRGETVSYEGTYTVSREKEVIGVLGIGYHDGLHRKYGNRAFCCVNGNLVPYIGNICMDFALVNLSDIKDVSVGDEVTIFGEDDSGYVLNPYMLAGEGGTCTHELLACLGPRIERKFIIKQNVQMPLCL